MGIVGAEIHQGTAGVREHIIDHLNNDCLRALSEDRLLYPRLGTDAAPAAMLGGVVVEDDDDPGEIGVRMLQYNTVDEEPAHALTYLAPPRNDGTRALNMFMLTRAAGVRLAAVPEQSQPLSLRQYASLRSLICLTRYSLQETTRALDTERPMLDAVFDISRQTSTVYTRPAIEQAVRDAKMLSHWLRLQDDGNAAV